MAEQNQLYYPTKLSLPMDSIQRSHSYVTYAYVPPQQIKLVLPVSALITCPEATTSATAGAVYAHTVLRL